MDVLKLIRADISNKKDMYAGRRYYFYRPPNIGEVDISFIEDGEAIIKKKKVNELYVNYFKMLVTQKIDYLLSKAPSVDKNIKDISGINVFVMLDELMFNASLDGKTWLHPYLKNNKMDYIIVKDQEIIPIYERDNKTLETIIRYYKLNDILNVEIWTKNGVQRLQYDNTNALMNENIESHYTTIERAGDNIEDTIDSNFDEIPFFCYENNKEVLSDVYDIENPLYLYNSICTGFIDNIEKFQEALLLLKGYISESKDLKNQMKIIQDVKAISVQDGGDASYLTVDIPVEARIAILDILRDVIFLIGRGVDPSKLAEGSNLTNVVLKSRYILLDFKSSDTEKRTIKFYDRFIDFAGRFYGINFSKDITMNKTMIINESEKIESCLKSRVTLSLRTILEQHPFVADVDEELKRIEAEKKTVVVDENINSENDT